jgi:hypothetical protein
MLQLRIALPVFRAKNVFTATRKCTPIRGEMHGKLCPSLAGLSPSLVSFPFSGGLL